MVFITKLLLFLIGTIESKIVIPLSSKLLGANSNITNTDDTGYTVEIWLGTPAISLNVYLSTWTAVIKN